MSPIGQIGDADEAVFGMMAQKIAALEEFPIYMWENHYAGAIVSYMAAPLFYFFGSGIVQLRLAMLLLALISPLLFYWIFRRMFNEHESFYAGLFLVFCPFIALYHTMAARGGYGETCVGMAVIILLSWKIRGKNPSRSLGGVFFLGFFCGFFFYIFFLIVPVILAFAVPAAWGSKEKRSTSLAFFSLGGILGMAPLIIYNVMNAGGTISRAAAWSLSVGRNATNLTPLDLISTILISKGIYLKTWFHNAPVMFGSYLMPQCFGTCLLTLAGWGLIVLFGCFLVKTLRMKVAGVEHQYRIRQFAAFLMIMIVFQWVVGLYSVRHLLPLFFIIPVVLFTLAGENVCRRNLAIIFMCLLNVFQILGWKDEMKYLSFDPMPVVKVMENLGISEFYGSYWTVYPIMFSANGKLIGAPLLLPFHEPLGDRRPAVTAKVRQSTSAAFVFGATEDTLMNRFVDFLESQDIRFRRSDIQRTSVFSHFSKPIDVEIGPAWNNRFVLKSEPSIIR